MATTSSGARRRGRSRVAQRKSATLHRRVSWALAAKIRRPEADVTADERASAPDGANARPVRYGG